MSGLTLIRSHRLQLAGAVAVIALAALAVLSVNTFPSVGNDSLTYIEHSLGLGDHGLIRFGFRNVGYPVFLAAVRALFQPLGLDPLLLAAVVQRLLLLVVAFMGWRLWRWFALPLIGVVVAPDVMAFSNLILIEGLAVGLAGVTGIAAYKCLQWRDESTSNPGRRRIIWFVMLCAATFALYAMKFTLGGFLVLPLIVLLAVWKHVEIGRLLVVGAIWLGVVLAFTLGLAVENSREQGVFSPSFDEYGAEYYYAWTQVFRHEENVFDLDLARFYDDGNVRQFLRETDSGAIPDQKTRLRLRRTEIEEMLEMSGAGVRRSQMVAALWALTGGRLHDTSRAIREITEATSGNIENAIHLNTYSLEEGYPAFAEVYNQGRSPGTIVTDSFGLRIVPRARLALKLGLPFSLLAAVIGLAIRSTRWLAVVALAPTLAHAGGLGLIRADNFRFLLPTAVYALVLATAIAARIYKEWNPESRSVQPV